MICLLVMTDGRRDCIEATIRSARDNLIGPISRRFIHDDSGDSEYRAWLASRFADFEIVGKGDRRGFGRAIGLAWEQVLLGSERFIFHLEDDFTFNRPVRLLDLVAALDDHPEMVQFALLRQPWNREERAAGGIIQQHPESYARCDRWIEHRRFFTTNPSLYRRSLCELGWPDVEHSEGIFTHQLLADPAARFAFWGAGDEWVKHIGRERVGSGY